MANQTTVLFFVLVATASPLAANDADDALDHLRADVDKLVQPYLIKDADVAVRIRQAVFSKATAYLAAIPDEQRKADFNATGESGHLWSAGGGLLGCGGYADINDGGTNLHLTILLHSLGLTWQPNGTMTASTDIELRANGNVKGHVNGPAGMCSGPSLKYPLGRWSCDCQIGGGIGSNAGFTASQRQGFAGHLALSAQPDGSIGYGLYLDSPQSVSVTVSVGLEKIGNIGIPVAFNMPTTPIVSGSGLGVLTNKGRMTVGGIERTYSISLHDLATSADASGFQVRAKGEVHVDPAPNA